MVALVEVSETVKLAAANPMAEPAKGKAKSMLGVFDPAVIEIGVPAVTAQPTGQVIAL
jgi:hypothetical protein